MKNEYTKKQKEKVKELEEIFSSKKDKPTIVEMEKNYADDDKICLTSLSFIPDKICERVISKIIERLRKIESEHYYYPPDQMHVTIKGVRTVNKPPLFNDSDIEKVDSLFTEVVPQFSVLEFSLEDVLLFPTSVAVMAYSNDSYQKLFLALDEGLKRIGVPDNKSYLSDEIFWGNVTVCRFVKNPSEDFIKEVKKMRELKIGSFKVEEVVLLTCNAVCDPKTQKIINRYKLK